MENKILTDREMEIIDKKSKGIGLTQNESNILSKSIRPKLREMSRIDASLILSRLNYARDARAIQEKIKKIILKEIDEVKAIILYGSIIQTNYQNYNDIDILIITKKRFWTSAKDKYEIISRIKKIAKGCNLILDIQILDNHSFEIGYPNSPSLIYQLKDSRLIYGKLDLLAKKELTKLDLRMKLDWSDIEDQDSDGKEIYNAVRNIFLVRLLMKKILDNKLLRESVNKELGEYLVQRLKKNTVSMMERKLVLKYIKDLSEKTDEEIKGPRRGPDEAAGRPHQREDS